MSLLSYLLCKKGAVVACISHNRTRRPALAILERHIWLVKLDWPRVLILVLVPSDGRTRLRGRPLHFNPSRNVSPFQSCPPSACLPLKGISRSWFWGTLWPCLGTRRLGIGHIVRKQWVILACTCCEKRSFKSLFSLLIWTQGLTWWIKLFVFLEKGFSSGFWTSID